MSRRRCCCCPDCTSGLCKTIPSKFVVDLTGFTALQGAGFPNASFLNDFCLNCSAIPAKHTLTYNGNCTWSTAISVCTVCGCQQDGHGNCVGSITCGGATYSVTITLTATPAGKSIDWTLTLLEGLGSNTLSATTYTGTTQSQSCMDTLTLNFKASGVFVGLNTPWTMCCRVTLSSTITATPSGQPMSPANCCKCTFCSSGSPNEMVVLFDGEEYTLYCDESGSPECILPTSGGVCLSGFQLSPYSGCGWSGTFAWPNGCTISQDCSQPPKYGPFDATISLFLSASLYIPPQQFNCAPFNVLELTVLFTATGADFSGCGANTCIGAAQGGYVFRATSGVNCQYCYCLPAGLPVLSSTNCKSWNAQQLARVAIIACNIGTCCEPLSGGGIQSPWGVALGPGNFLSNALSITNAYVTAGQQ